MIRQILAAAIISIGLLALDTPALAQDGGWVTPKEEKKQEPDPCAEERSKYPWGMGPCRTKQLQQENAEKKSSEELTEEEKKLQRRTQHNENVIINNQ